MKRSIKFYETAAGRSPVGEFLNELSAGARAEVLTLLRRLEGGEVLGMPQSRSLVSLAPRLFELRVRDSAGNVRLFYRIEKSGDVLIVHALWKKSRVIARRDRELIKRRLREITNAVE
jgi:phage-related protein